MQSKNNNNEDYNKQKKAILDATLPESQHKRVDLELGSRGGYNIKNSKKSDPLHRLKDAGRITNNQEMAGYKIQSLARISCIYAPSGMALGERVGGTFERKMSSYQLEAYLEYFEVCEEIRKWIGLDGMKIVIAVCVYGEAPYNAKFIPQRKRINTLIEGLDVADEYFN